MSWIYGKATLRLGIQKKRRTEKSFTTTTIGAVSCKQVCVQAWRVGGPSQYIRYDPYIRSPVTVYTDRAVVFLIETKKKKKKLSMLDRATKKLRGENVMALLRHAYFPNSWVMGTKAVAVMASLLYSWAGAVSSLLLPSVYNHVLFHQQGSIASVKISKQWPVFVLESTGGSVGNSSLPSSSWWYRRDAAVSNDKYNSITIKSDVVVFFFFFFFFFCI